MKKSFMTRVLAAGLSFAMAFSMAAATNVTTASAASKPKMITSSGASAKSLDVKLGEAVKIKVNAATKKTYKVSAVKASSSKLRVAKNKAGTVVTIRGMKATEEGKPASVKVSFKVKKTGKASKYSYVSKVNVIEDKLTMTAEATGVKKIDVTFNKAVGSDTKITLTKGTTTISQTNKIAEDGKSASIELTGKLTAGTYTVTAVAGDKTLTADIVTKDEVLTTFKLGSTLKQTKAAASSTSGASAVIAYEALNQYGERLNYQLANDSVSVSIGQRGTIKPCKTSGAGTIEVTDIPQIYAIAGQSFTFVLVDTQNHTGHTLNTTAVYGPQATAKTVEFAGVYSATKGKFKDIAEDDNIEDYELLFTAMDQYDDAMDSADVATAASNGAISVTVAGGLTNIAAGDLTDTTKTVREIGDVKYFAVPLTGAAVTANSSKAKAVAGKAIITVVNNTQGIVFTGEINVTSGIVIQNVTITAQDLIYASEDNELDFSVTDTNGNNITDYDTLKGITFKESTTGDSFYWKKNADGTAKLIYNPKTVAPATSGDELSKIKNSEVRSVTVYANKAISGNLKVVSTTFTVYHAKVAQSVGKVKASTVCVNATEAAIKLSDIVLLDQWYNELGSTSAAAKAAHVIVTSTGAMSTGDYFTTAAGVKAVTPSSVVTSVAVTNDDDLRVFTTTASLKLNFKVEGSKLPDAQNDGLTVKFSAGSYGSVAGLRVTKIAGGNHIFASWHKDDYRYAFDEDDVEVKGLINGVDTKIPSSEFSVVEANTYGDVYIAGVGRYVEDGAATETRTIHVIVNTNDGPQTIEGTFTASNMPGATKSIAKVSDTSAWGEYSDPVSNAAIDYVNNGGLTLSGIGTSSAIKYASAAAMFVVKNQYGQKSNTSAKITYVAKKITVSAAAAKVDGVDVTAGSDTKVDSGLLVVQSPGTSQAYCYINSNRLTGVTTGDVVKVELEVTATDGACSATDTVTVTFNI